MTDHEIPLTCPACGEKIDEKKVIKWGGWEWDEVNGRFLPGTPGADIHFTPREGQLIGAILRKHGDVVRHEDLFSAYIGNLPDCDWPEEQIVKVTIAHIRARIKMALNVEFCETIWGRGYAAVKYGIPGVNRHIFAVRKPCNECGHSKREHKTHNRQKDGMRISQWKGACKEPKCGCAKYED